MVEMVEGRGLIRILGRKGGSGKMCFEMLKKSSSWPRSSDVCCGGDASRRPSLGCEDVSLSFTVLSNPRRVGITDCNPEILHRWLVVFPCGMSLSGSVGFIFLNHGPPAVPTAVLAPSASAVLLAALDEFSQLSLS